MLYYFERKFFYFFSYSFYQGSIGGSKWGSIGNAEKYPLCLLDWISLSETAKQKSSAIFIHTPGRFGSILSPRELAVFDFEQVFLAVIIDQGHNSSSYRRQNSADNLKSPSDIASENPTQMACLLSLSGKIILYYSFSIV